jgi:hypothetical protein
MKIHLHWFFNLDDFGIVRANVIELAVGGTGVAHEYFE